MGQGIPITTIQPRCHFQRRQLSPCQLHHAGRPSFGRGLELLHPRWEPMIHCPWCGAPQQLHPCLGDPPYPCPDPAWHGVWSTKTFFGEIEDVISSPVDLPLAISHYQDVLQYAGSEINFAVRTSLYMALIDMLLHVRCMAGYNNLIVIGTEALTLGLTSGLNVAITH